MTNDQSNSNSQNPKHNFGHWDLGLDWTLGFGHWDFRQWHC